MNLKQLISYIFVVTFLILLFILWIAVHGASMNATAWNKCHPENKVTTNNMFWSRNLYQIESCPDLNSCLTNQP